MRTPTKLWLLTATEVLSLIKKDRLTVEDYAKALLGHIESRDKVVKAWQYFGILCSLPNMQRIRLTLYQIRTSS